MEVGPDRNLRPEVKERSEGKDREVNGKVKTRMGVKTGHRRQQESQKRFPRETGVGRRTGSEIRGVFSQTDKRRFGEWKCL